MTSQLCQTFQASQSAHGADDIPLRAALEPGQFSDRLWSPS